MRIMMGRIMGLGLSVLREGGGGGGRGEGERLAWWVEVGLGDATDFLQSK